MTRMRYLLTALLAATPLACLAQAGNAVPPHVLVEGRSQAEWSQRWWQWAGSFDDQDSPVADTTGEKCRSGQSGKVWFLAGTYEARRTTRTCTIPRDTYLFFPLINYVVTPGEASTSCGSVTADARQATEDISGLVLEVDGQRVADLKRYRQASPGCFDMGALMLPRARIYPSAANGYYAMLAPLPPGRHVLNFGGVLPGFAQAVTYTLIVK
jgi:hypothetical protein